MWERFKALNTKPIPNALGKTRELIQFRVFKILTLLFFMFHCSPRLVISDGIYYLQAMLATQLNSLANEGAIANRSVVRINEYICNKVQERR